MPHSYSRLVSGAGRFVPVGTSGASELEWTAGHADRPAKDSHTWPVGELFDNGSSLSGSGVIRAGERWWRARSSRATRKTCAQW